MYELSDNIIAVSSPSTQQRVIIRITGPDTLKICNSIFTANRSEFAAKRKILTGRITVDTELTIEALLYFFAGPNSYTGDDVAEIHIYTNRSVTETLINNLLNQNLRMAEPGEFTARAYLNGKIDLSQAEAVNEIIVSSNALQLTAAEKLLSGRLSQTIAEARSQILDCLSLIEAGLDFSEEDIEFISRPQAVERLEKIKDRLESLLAGSIHCESVMELPSVGIAGAPNAGKSSLLNKLLGTERSIVSSSSKTTRDILTGLLNLRHCRCVIFDCAGLLAGTDNILDELAQQAAVEALRHSAIVILCVDISEKDWRRYLSISRLIEPKILIPVATKCDLVPADKLESHLERLKQLFSHDFSPISALQNTGLESLLETIDSQLTFGRAAAEAPLALTSRHKEAVTAAAADILESIRQLYSESDEVAAVTLRAAYQDLSIIEQHGPSMDEKILSRIFSSFCIGK